MGLNVVNVSKKFSGQEDVECNVRIFKIYN